MSGVLIAVCGPSGAGKDTVLRLARQRLAGREEILFARRAITRPADSGEDNEALSPEDFARLVRAGGFLLHWQAHGRCYGLRVELLDRLRAGRVVVANVSRGVLAAARHLDLPFRSVEITASPALLAARLEQRGREDAPARAARLERNALYADGIKADHLLLNDAGADATAQALARIIIEARCAAAAGNA